MKPEIRSILSAVAILLATAFAASVFAQDQVKIANGALEGDSDKSSGVRSFKGIPFAEPPVGDLRWKPPQPVKNWQGARKADKFGPRCMQRADLRRHELSLERDERGLPLPERLDARQIRQGEAAGAGLLLRRRIHGGRRLGAALRRREHGGQGDRRRHGELSSRRVRVLRPSRTDERVAATKPRAITACSISTRRSSGCSRTSRPSAATRDA